MTKLTNPTNTQNQSLPVMMERSAMIVQQIISNEGEVSPLLEEEILALNTQQIHKVDAYYFVMEQLKLQASYFRDKAKLAQKVAQSLEGAEERLKNRLKELMLAFSKKELSGSDIRFKLSEGPKKLIIEQSELIPSTYLIPKTEIDNAKIKSELSEGKEIPGCRLESSLSLRAYPNTKILKGNGHE